MVTSFTSVGARPRVPQAQLGLGTSGVRDVALLLAALSIGYRPDRSAMLYPSLSPSAQPKALGS